MKQKSRVYLVGFMGSGKSYLGRKLAEELNYDFVDLDEVFERKALLTIEEYFERIGEDAFRLKESEILRTFYKGRCIYATGGGAPCHYNNMYWMNQHGVTIYLEQSVQVLFDRLRNVKATRPLIKHLSDANLKAYIDLTLEERAPYYEEADIVFNGDEKNLALLLRKLKDLQVSTFE